MINACMLSYDLIHISKVYLIETISYFKSVIHIYHQLLIMYLISTDFVQKSTLNYRFQSGYTLAAI